MYDIVRDGLVFDIGRIFCDSMDAITFNLFRSALREGNTNWISTFAGNQRALNSKLQNVVTALSAKE